MLRKLLDTARNLQTIMLSNEMTENFLLRISSAKGVATSIADKNTINLYYGNTGSRVFKRGVQNWKYFCLKINIPNFGN